MDHDVFCDDGPPISRLQAAVRALDEYVHQVVVAVAPSSDTQQPEGKGNAKAAPTPTPTATPVQRFGRQELARGRWRELARAHVVVYGLGAVGALAAEALVRAGVGKLLLVDSARVQLPDLGDMGAHPHELGFSRVQALRLRLQSISAATSVDSFSADVASDADLAELKKRLKASAVGASSPSVLEHRCDRPPGLFEALTLKRPYDAVLCCATDGDEAAKLRLNDTCLQLSLPLLDVDVPPSNAHVRLRAVLPGHTCCLECVRQHEAASRAVTPMDQVARSIARAFPARLPHVDAAAAGLVAQTAIKLLLDLGDFVPFFTLDLLTFAIESYSFPPSRSCPSAACLERQDEARAAAAS
ncbi:hypothetical protein PybrP1_009547 [[Pythium] brassicae (nom. inval.)]|nr:hypothetical protein PybrP1_009547 [[Pythium] brassicae (nom. inval.)]